MHKVKERSDEFLQNALITGSLMQLSVYSPDSRILLYSKLQVEESFL